MWRKVSTRLYKVGERINCLLLHKDDGGDGGCEKASDDGTTRDEGDNQSGEDATQCASGAVKCKLHLSLHGCSEVEYYDEAVHHLGFQEWGETNNIVILYPRVQPHGGTTESAAGCYDGYA